MKRIAIAVIAALSAGAAQAEESASRWSGESELGYIWKSGNTDSETLNAKQKLVYTNKPWVNTLTLTATNTSSDKVRSGERYYAVDQVDYFMTERTYGFGRASWEKDRFSGYDYRGTWVLGVGHQFVNNASFILKGEVGVGESIDKEKEDLNVVPVITGERHNNALGYLSESLVWKFSSSAELGQDLRVEHTKYNTNSRFDIYVKSTLVNNLALKVAYGMRYNTDVPEGTNHKDEEVTVTLSYSF